MKKGFVITENYRRLKQAQDAVEKRGAREAGLVLIEGQYGSGKSALIERWASDSGAIFLRCKKVWSVRGMLESLAELMQVDDRGSNTELQGRLITTLSQTGKSLVFDEADHLVPQKRKQVPTLLEVIRDITDMTMVPCFLVGMGRLGAQINYYGHIASRVNRVVHLQPASLADVKITCERLAEVQIADDLVQQLHRDTAGSMRLLLNAISNVEQLAAANGWKNVTADNVRGKQLCVDFRTQGKGTP